MSNGPAEASSKSERAASTLYIEADKDVKPGRFDYAGWLWLVSKQISKDGPPILLSKNSGQF